MTWARRCWSRFALYAFPVVVPVGAIAIWAHPWRRLLLGLAAAQGLAIFADLEKYGHPWLNRLTPSVWISATLMVLAAAVILWSRASGPRGPAQVGHSPAATS